MSAESVGPFVVGLGELLWDIIGERREIGGAPANSAYHAVTLGARGAVVSRVGEDDLGGEILERLGAAGVDVSAVSIDPEHPTGTVTVELEGKGKPRFRIHENAAWDFMRMDPAGLGMARRADAVCFGTLARRRRESAGAVRKFLAATRPECLRVFDVNLRQDYFSGEILDAGLRVSNVLKLSDEEASVVGGLLSIRGSDREVAEKLAERYSLRAVAVTRGEKGCFVLAGGEPAEHEGFVPELIVSTVGAGDAFTAVLVLGLLRRLRSADICERANRLASYVCTQPGAMPALPQALRALVAP